MLFLYCIQRWTNLIFLYHFDYIHHFPYHCCHHNHILLCHTPVAPIRKWYIQPKKLFTVHHLWQYLAMKGWTALNFPGDLQCYELHNSLKFQCHFPMYHYNIIQGYHLRCVWLLWLSIYVLKMIRMIYVLLCLVVMVWFWPVLPISLRVTSLVLGQCQWYNPGKWWIYHIDPWEPITEPQPNKAKQKPCEYITGHSVAFPSDDTASPPPCHSLVSHRLMTATPWQTWESTTSHRDKPFINTSRQSGQHFAENILNAFLKESIWNFDFYFT